MQDIIFLGILTICIGWGIWRLVDVDKTWERYVRKAKSRGIKPESLERTPEWEKRERILSIGYIVAGLAAICLIIVFNLVR